MFHSLEVTWFVGDHAPFARQRQSDREMSELFCHLNFSDMDKWTVYWTHKYIIKVVEVVASVGERRNI